MIAAMLEGVEEEFAGIAVNAFEGPPAAAVVPVSSHPQRQAAIVEAVIHSAKQKAVFGVCREFPLH